MLITPVRMMAPVGKEVVLVAGLYGDHNEFVPRQTIEWTLSNESAGHFLAAGDERDCLKAILHSDSNKRSGTYAVTRTSTTPKILTRGTPTPADDLSLLRGQTWASVSSPSEGTTYVTVLARDAKNWDQRRRTATIHWVDVQWTLPPSATIQASEPHTMTTLVTKSSGKPLPGWIVRYELQGDAAELFGPGSRGAVETVTDANGRASIQLSAPGKTATAHMEIKIIRPSMPDDDLPRTVVGRGSSTVVWSAPDPKITLYAPQTAAIGSTITYRAEVTNAGDVTSRQVVASTSIPPTMTYLRSDPPARVIGNQLTWELGDLPPGSVRSLNIQCRPERNATVRFSVRVDSADQLNGKNLWAEASYETRVFTSTLAVALHGPESAKVGETVTFDIEVSNTGLDPVDNIVIQDRLPAGLEGPTGRGSVLQFRLDKPLGPGQRRVIPLQLTPRQTGQLTHTVEVTGAGGHTAMASATLTAVQPAPPRPEPHPDLNLTLTGPSESEVGQTGSYALGVTNTGNVPLDLRVVQTFDMPLNPVEATAGFDRTAVIERAELIWTVRDLLPGKSLTRKAKYQYLQEASAAWVRVRVEALDGSVKRSLEKRTRIKAKPRSTGEAAPRIPSPQVPDLTAGDPSHVTGELKLEVDDTSDPVRIGGSTTYLVTLLNGRNVSDKNVDISILLPAGLEFVALRGPRYITARAKSPDGRTVELNRISEIRAGERIGPFYVDVRAKAIGNHVIRFRATSFRSPIAVEAKEDTTVNQPG